MRTEYSHAATIAVPSALIPDANHLALLLGESAADIGTFKNASYTDGSTEYAVAHTVVKPTFLAPTQTGELPPDPDHVPPEYDRSKAESAFATLGTDSGILLAIDVNPHEQFAEWGMSRIESEDEL
jgi:hypothetical protein